MNKRFNLCRHSLASCLAAIWFGLFFLATSCKKDELGRLPDATHSGANTMGCLLNGTAFGTSGKSAYGVSGVEFIPYGNTSWLISGEKGFEGVRFRFNYTSNTNIPATFPVKGGYYESAMYTDQSRRSFQTDSTHTGSITVTYYDGKIGAGTFSFDAWDGAGNIVHVTEGRFDIAVK